MDFRGRLRLPEDAGSGIPVDLRIEDVYLELWAGTEELGTWRLEVVGAERVNGNLFALNLDGEFMQFLADDPLGFAYEGVEYVEEIGARLRKRKPWKRQAPPTKAKSRKKKKPLLPPPEEPQQSPISRLDAITDRPGFIGSQDRPSVQRPPAAHVDPWSGVDPTPSVPAGSEYVSFHEGEPPSAPPGSEGQPVGGFAPFGVGPADQSGQGRGYVFDPFPQQTPERPQVEPGPVTYQPPGPDQGGPSQPSGPTYVEPGPAPYHPAEPVQGGPFQPSEPNLGGYPPVPEPPTWGGSPPDVSGIPPQEPTAPPPPAASAAPMAPPTQEVAGVPPEKRSILDRLESAAGRPSRGEEIPAEEELSIPGVSTDSRGVPFSETPRASGSALVDPAVTKEAAERIEHAAERIESAADRIDADVVESSQRYRGVTDSRSETRDRAETPEEEYPPAPVADTTSRIPEDELIETEIEPDLTAASRGDSEPLLVEQAETPSAVEESTDLVEPATEEALSDEGSDWAAAAGIEEEIQEWPVAPIQTEPQQVEEPGHPETETEERPLVSAEAEETLEASQEEAPQERVGEWDAQADDSLASLDRSFGDELRRLVESMSSTVYDLGSPQGKEEEPAEGVAEDQAEEVPESATEEFVSDEEREPLGFEATDYSDVDSRTTQGTDRGYPEPPASPWAAPPLEEGVGRYNDVEAYQEAEPAASETEEPYFIPEQGSQAREPEPAPQGYWEREQESPREEIPADDWSNQEAMSPWHIPAEGEWVVPTIEATTARPAALPEPVSYRELDEVEETDENALELDRKDRADRAASKKTGKKRGRRGIHEHNYEVAKTVGGITRLICTECGHLSFHTEDTHQEW